MNQTARTEIGREVAFTRDGVPYVVRPIRPGDRNALLEAFGHLSERSRYARFLRPIKRLTSDEATYFTEVDHRDHEALVAIAPSDELIGVARYIRQDDSETAEVAITVADDWQQRGVGTHLLHELADRARERGIGSFSGICLTGNARMLDLVRELGPYATTRSAGDGTTEFEVVLPTDGPKALAAALGAAARHSQAKSATAPTKEK